MELSGMREQGNGENYIMIVLLLEYYSSVQIEKNEMGGTLAIMWRGEVHIGFWWENQRVTERLKDPGLEGNIILRWIFRKRDEGEMDWISLAQDRETCKCGNEPSGSIKSREFLD